MRKNAASAITIPIRIVIKPRFKMMSLMLLIPSKLLVYWLSALKNLYKARSRRISEPLTASGRCFLLTYL